MKFTFQAPSGKTYSMETIVRVKDSAGNLQVIDTAAVLGSRYVTDFSKASDKQVVVLSESSDMWSQSLLTEDGKSIRVILDKSQGIVNPYITINNWSVRDTASANGKVTVSSVLCPFPIEDLPSTIPLDNVNVASNKNGVTNSSKPIEASNSNDRILTLAAATVGVLLHAGSNKDKKYKSSEEEGGTATVLEALSSRNSSGNQRQRLIDKLRSASAS